MIAVVVTEGSLRALVWKCSGYPDYLYSSHLKPVKPCKLLCFWVSLGGKSTERTSPGMRGYTVTSGASMNDTKWP